MEGPIVGPIVEVSTLQRDKINLHQGGTPQCYARPETFRLVDSGDLLVEIDIRRVFVLSGSLRGCMTIPDPLLSFFPP
jgi:hypothetical protein